MDLNQLTIPQLRLIKQGLNRLAENSDVKELRILLVEAVDDKMATQHMIETGRYPSWYNGDRKPQTVEMSYDNG